MSLQQERGILIGIFILSILSVASASQTKSLHPTVTAPTLVLKQENGTENGGGFNASKDLPWVGAGLGLLIVLALAVHYIPRIIRYIENNKPVDNSDFGALRNQPGKCRSCLDIVLPCYTVTKGCFWPWCHKSASKDKEGADADPQGDVEMTGVRTPLKSPSKRRPLPNGTPRAMQLRMEEGSEVSLSPQTPYLTKVQRGVTGVVSSFIGAFVPDNGKYSDESGSASSSPDNRV